ncbi:MAG: helix-turn-helix domain-containing protein [Dethiobacter sp.]|nr:helix-turn-helix domain-containing protein [Dethiobacter sp.]MBS3901076.1 helix-turn-helix domain-containing protein [Dethiobacter sp.]MBS3988890.1 helix-turn-helix domain-containing protein [Dethiobacter sp.]
MEKFYTPREVRQLLRISAPTFQRLVSRGILQGVRLGGEGHYRVHEQALQKFLKENSTAKEV